MWNAAELRLSVVAAASSDPAARRANTIDTFLHWAERRDPARVDSVLIVTTPIYVPYQNAVAVEALGVGHGIAVDTVGVSASANDLGQHSQEFRAQHHLQELRSAIRAMRMLLAALIARLDR